MEGSSGYNNKSLAYMAYSPKMSQKRPKDWSNEKELIVVQLFDVTFWPTSL